MNHAAKAFVSMGLLALLPVAPLTAQNLFEIYPTRPNISTTDYTRLCAPLGGGEILVEVAPTHFCNVGGSTTCTCSALDIDVTLQDLDDATPNQFRGKVYDAFWLLIGSTAWTPMTPGTGGPSVETFRVPFIAPVALPCNGTYYFGIEVDAAACNDGIYVAAARYASNLSGCGGETGRAGAPSLLFCGPVGGPGAPWLGPKQYSLRMGITMNAPVLNMGNRVVTPAGLPCFPWATGYGVGGLYPLNTLLQQELWARVQDVNSPNGTALLFADIFPAAPPFCIPPFGLLCLNPHFTVCTIPLDAAGLGTCRALPINLGMAGKTLYFQAVSLGTGLLTNAETVRL